MNDLGWIEDWAELVAQSRQVLAGVYTEGRLWENLAQAVISAQAYIDQLEKRAEGMENFSIEFRKRWEAAEKRLAEQEALLAKIRA